VFLKSGSFQSKLNKQSTLGSQKQFAYHAAFVHVFNITPDVTHLNDLHSTNWVSRVRTLLDQPSFFSDAACTRDRELLYPSDDSQSSEKSTNIWKHHVESYFESVCGWKYHYITIYHYINMLHLFLLVIKIYRIAWLLDTLGAGALQLWVQM